MAYPEIPIWLAQMPRRAGLSWREIADFIETRTGRRYQPNSLVHAYFRTYGPDAVRAKSGRKPRK